MCQIIETISSLGPSWHLIWAVLYWNNPPTPFSSSVKKECRGISSWYHDKESIWILALHFPLSVLCLLVGATLRNVAQPLGNGTWIIPVISVMYSVMGVIKSFSFEVRSNFSTVADECSFRYLEEADGPGLLRSSGWTGEKSLRKLKRTILKIPRFQDIFLLAGVICNWRC